MKKITQKTVADRLRISSGLFSMYLAGKRRPGPETAMRLERATGINARVWLYGSASEIISDLERFFGKKINFRRGRPSRG